MTVSVTSWRWWWHLADNEGSLCHPQPPSHHTPKTYLPHHALIDHHHQAASLLCSAQGGSLALQHHLCKILDDSPNTSHSEGTTAVRLQGEIAGQSYRSVISCSALAILCNILQKFKLQHNKSDKRVICV